MLSSKLKSWVESHLSRPGKKMKLKNSKVKLDSIYFNSINLNMQILMNNFKFWKEIGQFGAFGDVIVGRFVAGLVSPRGPAFGGRRLRVTWRGRSARIGSALRCRGVWSPQQRCLGHPAAERHGDERFRMASAFTAGQLAADRLAAAPVAGAPETLIHSGRRFWIFQYENQ